ncbi:hypothetical protein J2S40_001146 [Nocardioides luteus]|uniref:hypothetical protein n=1 Tax=Nocardioides luteus TaxID=1844 RepID=UPI0016641F50|nr:hypothetical protein [Nocardioides luteus]MDR7310088.1 hypothetical protein [Nocardioides luteus]
MTSDSAALDILAEAQAAGLVQVVEENAVEPSSPPPPIGSSPAATAYWYAVLEEQELTLSEMAILEQIAETRTMLDLIQSAWVKDGQPTTSKGSMGQEIIEPRIQEIRQIRSQLAALIKQLGAATDTDGNPRRRPGRPSRTESGGRWGTRS